MFRMNNSCDRAFDSLDVRFTKACDNNCEFCIEKTGIESLGETDVDAMVKAAMDSGIKNMLILGGEPFLMPEKLFAFVVRCRPYFETIYITTSLPNTFNTNTGLCCHIIDLIDGLNVSFHSTNDDVNNGVFNATSRHSRTTILKQLNELGYDDKIRVCINLVRGGIDTALRLFQTLIDLYELGCKSVKINELQHSEGLYVSFEKIMNKSLPSPFSYGCSTEIELIVGMKTVLKRSCFITNRSLNATFMDVIKSLYRSTVWHAKNRFAVLYENGMISTHWKKGTHTC